jgi:DNA-binding transcriptional LysR family regulator
MAVLPSIAAGLIPAAVQRFTKLHPGIVVQIRDVVTAKITEAVKAEEVDFGIGGRSATERELLGATLFTDRMGAFVSESHPLAKHPFVTLKQLSETSLILPRHDSSVREIVEAAFKRENYPFTYAYEANYMSTALGLVEIGAGVAVLPEIATGSECSSKIKCLPIRQPELSRKVEVLQRRDRTLSPAALKMLEIIREIAKSRFGRR